MQHEITSLNTKSWQGEDYATAYSYAYDNAGNQTTSTVDYVATEYSANSLNQYTSIARDSAPLREPSYDLDGNLLSDGVFTCSWDAENRLVAVYSNSVCVVSNAYDYMSRRVAKWTPSHTTTFVYDGWSLIMEIHNSTIPPFQSFTKQYYWGNDLSGTLQGAGGVGGLLAVSIDGAYYLPCYDNNGNITAYVNEQGAVVAQYAYDAFGATIAQSGAMAGIFRFRFSTKYYDSESGLCYYGYRFYSPELERWLNRDPLKENGGVNLYSFASNNSVTKIDFWGLKVLVIDVEAEKGAEQFSDITQSVYKNSFALIDDLLGKMERVSETLFNTAKEKGKIKFNGNAFTGSRQEFIDILKREKESMYVKSISAGYEGSLAKLRSFAALATKDYDVVALAAHGIRDENETPIGKIVFNGTYIDTETAIKDIRAAGKTASAATFIISCYRTWKPGDDLKSTEEGLGIKPAWGYVSFGVKTTRVNGAVTSETIESCAAAFNPIGVRKVVGGKYVGPEEYR